MKLIDSSSETRLTKIPFKKSKRIFQGKMKKTNTSVQHHKKISTE